MKITSQRIVLLLMIIFMAQILAGCASIYATARPGFSSTPGIESQGSDYAIAEATLVSGQNEMTDLSHQATMLVMEMEQAANAVAQTTLDYNQHLLMELSIQSTEISQDITQAAATQQFIIEQTQIAGNATDTARSQAATATYSAYILNITQIAQAQELEDIQALKTAQANATLMTYSLTATPWAAIQADIARKQDKAEQRASREEFVATFLKFILITLAALLLIAGGVLAYQRLMPVLELRLRTIISRDNDSLILLKDEIIAGPDTPNRRIKPQGLRLLKNLRRSGDKTPPIEIIDPSEKSITNWITEAEHKLRSSGRIQP